MLGNPHDLPVARDYLEDLGATAQKYRIYRLLTEPGTVHPFDPDEDDELPWQVDEYAILGDVIAVSAWVENFGTFDDAVTWVREALDGTP